MRWRSASDSIALAAADEGERVERRVDDDDHVEVRALGVGPADGVGLEDLRRGDDVAEPVEGERQVALAVAEVGAEGDDRPVRRAWRDVEVGAACAGCVTAVVSTCSAIGGRSLVTVSSTASTRSKPTTTSAMRSASRSSSTSLFSADDGRDPIGDLAVVDGVAELVAAAGVAQVDDERQVDAQRLGDLPLVGKGADDGRDHQAVDLDPVGQWDLQRCRGAGSRYLCAMIEGWATSTSSSRSTTPSPRSR